METIIRLKGNQSNLHIYGDYLKVLVENNDCNLHIYGTHNDVSIIKGKAVTYGYYGTTIIHKEGKADFYGKYKSQDTIVS